MATLTGTDLQVLCTRFAAALNAQLERHADRPHWNAGRLASYQRERLRTLLARAVAQSPFHARRLAGIDPGRFELADLARLPVMTKEQMMACFDELATDRRLTRAGVEQHLAASAEEPSLLFDEYVCLASGGSSGLRGIFTQTIEEFAGFVASFLGSRAAALAASGGPPPDGVVVAVVGAASPVHASGFGAAAGAGGYPLRTVSAPATLPVAELVQRLNQAQPLVLQAHTSKLALLAEEKRAGRLRIAPVSVTAMGEPLTDGPRAAIGRAFGVPPVNQFTSTEGLAGQTDPGGEVIRFASDMCITELVDDDNQPVPDGTPSAKVLLTNLYNHTQPLIRYELIDRFTRQATGPGHGHLRATVQGRADDTFRYANTTVDPLVIRTVMVRTPAALEYQVRQTSRGIDVAVVAGGLLDHTALAAALGHSLRTAGLPDPQVNVQQVADIARHPETGKARRFIPF
jgi:phenylacetate-coenzyme A ligase PaaK-like adenylate-forming protein